MAEELCPLLSRRDFLLRAGACSAVPFLPARVFARTDYPTRSIPNTGEPLPVIGLGSTKAMSQLEARGTTGFTTLLRTLLNGGGTVVDTWSRDAAQERLTGEALQADEMVHELFLATKVDAVGTRGWQDPCWNVPTGYSAKRLT